MEYTYTRFGAPATIKDGVGTHTFAYNSQLQQTSETVGGTTSGGGSALFNKIITRVYDTSTNGTAGRYVELDIGTNGDATTDYVSHYYYDSVGRLSRVTGPGLPAYGAQYDYSTHGDFVSQLNFRDGSTHSVATTAWTLESQRDLIATLENKWDSTIRSKYWYTNDALGRRTNRVDTGTAYGSGQHEIYTYNARSELLTAKRYNDTNTHGTSSPMTGRHYTYAYDNIGNRTSYQIDANTATTYDMDTHGLNQYAATTHPTEAFTYDADGNLLTDGSWTYVWDAENRLIRQTPTDHVANNKLHWTYDYMNRRVRRIGYTWNTGTGDWNTNANNDRTFIADGWNDVFLINNLTGAANRGITRGLDLSGLNGNNHGSSGPSVPGLHGAGGIGGLLGMKFQAATPNRDHIFCMDGNGNVGQLLASSNPSGVSLGDVATKYEYDPYGNAPIAADPGSSGNQYQYSSKYAAVGFYDYGYRWLHSRLGRWLSRDPMGEKGGTMLYAFTRNTPNNRIDPIGLKCQFKLKGTLTKPGELHDLQPVMPGNVFAEFLFHTSPECCCKSLNVLQIVKAKVRFVLYPDIDDDWQYDGTPSDPAYRDDQIGVFPDTYYGDPFYAGSKEFFKTTDSRGIWLRGNMTDEPGVSGDGYLGRDWETWWYRDIKMDFETCVVCVKSTDSSSQQGSACILGCMKWGYLWKNVGGLGVTSAYIDATSGPPSDDILNLRSHRYHFSTCED